jgi:hypothetical protein
MHRPNADGNDRNTTAAARAAVRIHHWPASEAARALGTRDGLVSVTARPWRHVAPTPHVH